MKLLHITPHLGGGVGKAHAEICAVSQPGIKRTFLLLEEPRDSRFADTIRASGADVRTVTAGTDMAALVAEADIVQIEYWNHPKLFECLAMTDFPAMRPIIWSHVSGLFAPFIAPELLPVPDHFVFTSPCSFQSGVVKRLAAETDFELLAIGSGFGFRNEVVRPSSSGTGLRIGYLGTVDFAKMHPDLFQMVDAIDHPDLLVSIWGGFDADGAVAQAVKNMQHPERIRLCGHCDNPQTLLSQLDLYLYPLHPEHYGTAENALIEAMSAGAVPLVLNNPAESSIVIDGITGLVAQSMEDCRMILDDLLKNPGLIAGMGERAKEDVQLRFRPETSAGAFAALYKAMLAKPKRKVDFRPSLGKTPQEWFLSTQPADGISERFSASQTLAKGSLRHFADCFPEDQDLRALLKL